MKMTQELTDTDRTFCSVEECFKSGFKDWCRDLQIISDYYEGVNFRHAISVGKTPLYKRSVWSWNVQ